MTEFINGKVNERSITEREAIQQQNKVLEGMKALLIEFSTKLDQIKEAQEENAIKPITNDEIDAMINEVFGEKALEKRGEEVEKKIPEFKYDASSETLNVVLSRK